jgi:hypothetical protein
VRLRFGNFPFGAVAFDLGLSFNQVPLRQMNVPQGGLKVGVTHEPHERESNEKFTPLRRDVSVAWFGR